MEYVNLPDERLVEISKTGDNKATETLILRYKNLVKAIARSYFLADGALEDLLQEGDIGLFKAIEGFNGSSSFKSYAFICVKSAVISAIKKSNSNKNKSRGEKMENKRKTFCPNFTELYFSELVHRRL